MPQRIRILPEQVHKQVAAGEVVERPASVVKELIENAIDARASRITLQIKDAGSELIQVIDDGVGMGEDDALICCKRHATSKIATVEDLEHVETLGFRGEALASIGSVSKMTIVTKTADEDEATWNLIKDI